MTWATFRALRQPSALSMARLADLEAQLHLGLRHRIAYRRNTTPERRSSDREPSVAGYQSRVLTH